MARCTTFGADWEQSYHLALRGLPGLMGFADDWDFDAECLRLNVEAAR